MKSKVIQKKHKNGFTLIEIMVAVSIFAMVMVVAIGSVLSIVAANKKAQAYNSVITNLNFALEGMMRDLRTGYNYHCGLDTTTGAIGTTPRDCPDNPEESIGFYSSQYNNPVKYQLMVDPSDSQKHYIYKSVSTGAPSLLTSKEINITKLDFYVRGSSDADDLQPSILIVIAGTYSGYGREVGFSMQTLVSQRNLDVPDV